MWVYYFNAQNRHGGITVSVVPRQFDKVIENYLGKQGEERWSLVLPGAHLGRSYGVAHKPDGVYETEQAAHAALRIAVIAKINALEEALLAAMKGGGVA